MQNKFNYNILVVLRAWLYEVSCLVGAYCDEQVAEMTTVENFNKVDLKLVEDWF